MYDMHYDLLTILYFNFLKNNKYANKVKCIEDINRMYSSNNIKGGIINLYFMSEEEMKNELGINKEKLVDVLTMFKESIDILSHLKDKNIIPKDIDFLYSIEGCDYIKNLDELEELYNLGLRAILPVWNNENIYGSGFKSEKGLTKYGEELIKKAIDLGMIIDLSHSNPSTFKGIIDVINREQQKGKNPIIIASHSNCKSLCNRKRNLTDEQLINLNSIGGSIGLFSNSNFLSTDFVDNTHSERQKWLLKHIKHVLNLGFPVDKIVLSTDDMNFSPDSSYHGSESFNLNNIKNETYKLLSQEFRSNDVKKLMYKNAIRIFNNVRDRG